MTPLTEAQRKKMEELAETYASTLISFSHEDWRKYYLAYKTGFTAAIEMQNEQIAQLQQEVEFDERKAFEFVMNSPTREVFVNAFTKKENAMMEAMRWQHSQDALKIAQLQHEVELLTKSRDHYKQGHADLAAELESLNHCYKDLDNYRTEQSEKLAASQEQISQLQQTIFDQDKVIIDQVSELASSQAQVRVLKEALLDAKKEISDIEDRDCSHLAMYLHKIIDKALAQTDEAKE